MMEIHTREGCGKMVYRLPRLHGQLAQRAQGARFLIEVIIAHETFECHLCHVPCGAICTKDRKQVVLGMRFVGMDDGTTC